jgi:hypothetical protein
MKSFRWLLLFALILAAILYVIIHNEPNHLPSGKTIRMKNFIRKERCATLSRVVILLQRSVVDGSSQMDRLRSVDEGWARLTEGHDGVSVEAAVDFDLINQSKYFRNLHPLTMRSNNPLRRLIDSLMEVAKNHEDMDWIVLANDHTFVIPTNLKRYLNSLDPGVAVYTGNMLKMTLGKNDILRFASGGAGAVLSKSSLKCMLLAWALTATDSQIVDSLSFLECKETHPASQCINYSQELNASNHYTAIRLMGNTLPFGIRTIAAALTLNATKEIHIELSKYLHADVYFHFGDYYLLIKHFDMKNASLTSLTNFSRKQLQRYCIDTSEWGMRNPGRIHSSFFHPFRYVVIVLC